MKKYRFLFLSVLVLYFLFCLPVQSSSSQSAYLNHVSDMAKVLSIQQAHALQKKAEEVFQSTGFDIILHTTNDSEEKGPMNYTMEYYHSFRDAERFPDGAMFAIIFDTRDYYEATRGRGLALMQRGSDELSSVVQTKLSNGDYFGAMMDYIDYVIDILSPNDVPVQTQNAEIIFRGIPWGTNFENVQKALKAEDISITGMSGETWRKFPLREIIYGSPDDFKLEKNINIWTITWGTLPKVAGFQLENLKCYFSFLPVDGILTRKYQDSALYAAEYEIMSKDSEALFEDLKAKLTSLYGDVDAEELVAPRFSLYVIAEHYAFWDGINDTRLILKWVENEAEAPWDDSVYIIYIWNNGDNLLRAASEAALQMILDEEKEIREQKLTDGL